MANSRDLKQLENDFQNIIKNETFKELILNHPSNILDDNNKKDFDKIESNNYEKFLKDYLLNKLNSDTENEIDLISDEKKEKFLILNEDTNLKIQGIGFIYILIENDILLNLEFENLDFEAIYIKIIIKENLNVKINEINNNKYLWKNTQIYLQKNSNLNLAQFSFGIKFNDSKIFLEKNTNYNLKSAYYINNSNSYMKNSAIHLENNSNSNLSVKGSVINNSNVYSDGLIKIEKDAINSNAYQKLSGVLLDDSSSIKSEPVLEILNNEVKCSHGADIAQIKEELLFYMEAKGIEKEDAVKLYLIGFFNEAINLNEFDLNLDKYIS